nr:hypothetical protein [Desulfobacula sp.]
MTLRTLGDIRRFLSKIVNMLLKNEIDLDRARGLGYLGSILKDCIKESDLETRTAELEAFKKQIEEKDTCHH